MPSTICLYLHRQTHSPSCCCCDASKNANELKVRHKQETPRDAVRDGARNCEGRRHAAECERSKWTAEAASAFSISDDDKKKPKEEAWDRR